MSQAELAAALVAAQKELKNPPKDKSVHAGARRYRYTDHATLTEQTREVLARHGLAILHTQEIRDAVSIGVTTLLHTSGESVRSEWGMLKTDDAQAIGSWLTYMRRYATCGMLYLASDDDDDGETAQEEAKAKAEAAQALAKQRKSIKATSAYDGRTLQPGEDPRPPETQEKPNGSTGNTSKSKLGLDSALVDGKLLQALQASAVDLDTFYCWYVAEGWYPDDVKPQDLPADFIEEVLESWQKILPKLKGAPK